MRLLTSIAARRDGTVQVQGDDGAAWVFQADADGRLACEIDDAPLVQRLMRSGNFSLAQGQLPMQAVSVEPDADLDEIEGDDAEGAVESAPLEANTPPASVPGARRRGRPPKER